MKVYFNKFCSLGLALTIAFTCFMPQLISPISAKAIVTDGDETYLESDDLRTGKVASGTRVWNMSPKSFTDAYFTYASVASTVFDAGDRADAIRIGDVKKSSGSSNYYVISNSACNYRLRVYSSSDSFTKSKVSKITFRFNIATDDDEILENIIYVIQGIVVIMTEYDADRTTEIIKKLWSNDDSFYKTIAVSSGSNKYQLSAYDDEGYVTFTVLPK